jgi:hypothetical protein
MLNELYQIANSLECAGVSPKQRHPRIGQGKNETTLVVRLNENACVSAVELLDGEIAAKLFRIEHGSPGSSFPGFNIPAPLRTTEASPLTASLLKAIKDLHGKKNLDAAALRPVVSELFNSSSPRDFSRKQKQQFQLSCKDLVEELHDNFGKVPSLTSEIFFKLLQVVKRQIGGNNAITLDCFSADIANTLSSQIDGMGCEELFFFSSLMFGKPKSKPNQHVYLDLATNAGEERRIANLITSERLNDACFDAKLSFPIFRGKDVFDGLEEETDLMEKYSEHKIAMGNIRLFSVNASEGPTFFRYKLGGAKTFPVSVKNAIRMNSALIFLGGAEKKNNTCIFVPDGKGASVLLIAYLENSDDIGRDSDGVVEMFGMESDAFSETDFTNRTKAVLNMFHAKIEANPDLSVRLLAICSVDTANKQAALNRVYRVADVVKAATKWEAQAKNIPKVSIFWKCEEIQIGRKKKKKPLFKSPVIPAPADLVSVVNRVWSRDAKQGFADTFQSAFSIGDAYDVFIPDTPFLSREKTNRALQLLVARMSGVLAAVGGKQNLGENVRKHALKAIPLLGLLLKKLEQPTTTNNTYTTFMKEPLYQLGHMLALADSLHQQYCEHVRKGETPTQLIGNALFNTALEQPVTALSRLAERLAPYQAWAKTFSPAKKTGEKSGLEKWTLGKLRECAKRFIEDVNGVFHIRTDELPTRMSAEDKAKLLLGYLADTYEPKADADAAPAADDAADVSTDAAPADTQGTTQP